MENETIALALQEAMPYINYFVGKTIVIKLGGHALEEQRSVLQDIVALRNLRANPVLVHGGGPFINEWLKKIGIRSNFINGLRVTDHETMEIVQMVLAGKLNKELVMMLTQLGGLAIGISGLDGGMVRAQKEDPTLGLVGQVTDIDLRPIRALINEGYIPVIAPLGFSPDGECLNINADTVAAEVARAMRAEKLIFLTDVIGIKNQKGDLISHLTVADISTLIENGVIAGGMIPKVQACVNALETVRRTHIIDGRIPHVLIRELFTNSGAGTMITETRDETMITPIVLTPVE